MKIRNLIYHVCPLTSNDLWRRNIEQLLARISVFNGRRVIAISNGDPERLHPTSEVERAFKNCGCSFITVRNDRSLREVASFRLLLDRVQSERPDECTFYAHTKGNSTADDVQGATYWRNAMYHVLLDTWYSCMDKLDRGYSAVGSHKMIWAVGQRPPYPTRLRHGHWMFAGTYFWFRHDHVFTNSKWVSIPHDRYGAEAWLSGMFEPDRCFSVFQPWPEDVYPAPNPYDPKLYIRMGMAIPDEELKHPSYCI